MKNYAKFGYADHLRFGAFVEKPQRGGDGQNDPPPWRRLKEIVHLQHGVLN